LALHVEVRRILEIEVAHVVLGHQSESHRASQGNVRSGADIGSEIRRVGLQNGRVDIVSHGASADLGKGLQTKTARGGHWQIELQASIVEQGRAVRDRVSAEEWHADGNVGAGVADVADE